MTYSPVSTLSVSPGSLVFFPGIIQTNARVIVARNDSNLPVGLISGYVSGCISRDTSPSGGIAAAVTSKAITGLAVFVPAPSLSAVYGGWSLAIYGVKRRNSSTVSYTIFVELG